MRNRREAALSEAVLSFWTTGCRTALLRRCGLPDVDASLVRGLRLPATDVAWREFDLATSVFHVSDVATRIIIELKDGGLGYRSLSQVLFYKHVLAPRHSQALGADRLVFVLLGAAPNPARWWGVGNLESDGQAFSQLFKPEVWPDPDVHVISYADVGLEFDQASGHWRWSPRTSGLTGGCT